MPSSLLVLANRLPVRRLRTASGDEWVTSPGGLVAALEPVLGSRPGSTWIGCTGLTGRRQVCPEVGGIILDAVPMSHGEMQLFYEGFCNATLWPLYHDAVIRSEYHRFWWDSYQVVNHRFAEHAARSADEDAVVWVHDYQLQLVPNMLRSMRPDLRIGFFLHIPFPPIELFLQLPWRRQILEGLAGADVVGFQTAGGAANFRSLVERLGVGVSDGDDVIVHGRRVNVRVFPIGVDVAGIERMARDPAMIAKAAEIRRSLGDPETVMLGVDRLDYTKGIPLRLEAIGELLAEERIEVPRHILILVAEPTRENVPGYTESRELVDRMVGDINGTYGLVGQPAINYIHRTQSTEEVVALYMAADVMLVTPLRDGMNLVAKEFVATRLDNTGALVLSEFTGAAESLRSAVLVNPYDTDGVKDAIDHAVHMSTVEARDRMQLMRETVTKDNVHAWAEKWMDALGLATVS